MQTIKRERDNKGKFISEGKTNIVKCKTCKSFFKAFDYQVKAGKKYCSYECRNKDMVSHNLSRTKFYKTWDAMRYRCTKDSPISQYYKDKGIKVFDKWLKFEGFRDDMYESYQNHCSWHGANQTTIDRINTDGNYEINNCRWATKLQQGENRSNVRKIKIDGEHKTLRQLSEKYCVTRNLLYDRVYRQGWDINKAIKKKKYVN